MIRGHFLLRWENLLLYKKKLRDRNKKCWADFLLVFNEMVTDNGKNGTNKQIS